MTDSGAYAAQWRDLTRRDLLFWLLFATYLPGVAITIVVLNIINHNWTKENEVWIAIGWLAAWMVAGFYRGTFKCPHCGGTFFSNDRWHNSFTTKCLNCGIRRGEGPTSEARRTV